MPNDLSQATERADVAQQAETLWSLIRGVPTAMLVTEDDSGDLRARPMANRQTGKFDGTLRFFTAKDTPKLDEAKAARSVCVTFADPAHEVFVSVSGRAEIVRDQAEIRAHWHKDLAGWFPDGPDDPELALLRISVDTGEYWDTSRGEMVTAHGDAHTSHSDRHGSDVHGKLRLQP